RNDTGKYKESDQLFGIVTIFGLVLTPCYVSRTKIHPGGQGLMVCFAKFRFVITVRKNGSSAKCETDDGKYFEGFVQ
ncbi:hypothetical protein RUM43_005856, partial [Polyplax serrata]